MISIKQIKADIATLPPFKETILAARDLLRQEDTSASDLVEVLQYDVGITTNILKVCNSPYYGLRMNVTNLQQAIVYLGNNTLREILIVSGSLEYFQGEQKGYEAEYGELWRHSIASAILAKQLGEQYANGDEMFFISGLLHDVGKLILGQYVEDQYQEIIACVQEDHVPFHEAERKILGMHHGEVGGLMLQHWNFPDEVVAAAANHHADDTEHFTDAELIIALADRLSGLMGTGTLHDSMYYRGIEGLCRYFGIREHDIEYLLSAVAQEIRDILHSTSYEAQT